MGSFEINGTEIAAGEQGIVRLNVGYLPSGNKVYIKAHIYNAPEPGPRVLVLGGLHGDEINGVEIVRRCIANEIFDPVKRGTVIAIPVLNIYGFLNFSRDVPDGKDVNRSFPGNMKGSLASRVARTLTKKVLPLVDFGIDFHTGGTGRYNYPQVRYSIKDPDAYELAKLFSAPFLVRKPLIRSSLRKAAFDMNVPIVVFEGGEAKRFDGLSTQMGIDGILRVFHSLGMLDQTAALEKKSIHITKASWIRATLAGIFVWYRSSGQFVKKGERLGEISDPHGEKTARVVAPRDGYIIGHTNTPVINQGDALFHIGYEHE